jgi:E3 ubiquitin-protein ligase SHPRH
MVCEEMGLGKTIEVLALIAHDLQANRGVKLESETLAAGRWAKQCKPKDALRKEADARGRAAYEEYMESVDEKIRRGEITIRDAVSEACEAQKSARAAIPDDRENGSVPSRATLVVVPPPLLRQWEAEVKKCLNESSLALVVYGGKGPTPYPS